MISGGERTWSYASWAALYACSAWSSSGWSASGSAASPGQLFFRPTGRRATKDRLVKPHELISEPRMFPRKQCQTLDLRSASAISRSIHEILPVNAPHPPSAGSAVPARPSPPVTFAPPQTPPSTRAPLSAPWRSRSPCYSSDGKSLSIRACAFGP